MHAEETHQTHEKDDDKDSLDDEFNFDVPETDYKAWETEHELSQCTQDNEIESPDRRSLKHGEQEQAEVDLLIELLEERRRRNTERAEMRQRVEDELRPIFDNGVRPNPIFAQQTVATNTQAVPLHHGSSDASMQMDSMQVDMELMSASQAAAALDELSDSQAAEALQCLSEKADVQDHHARGRSQVSSHILSQRDAYKIWTSV